MNTTDPTYCQACNGSGETTVLSGGGPDAYDVPYTCTMPLGDLPANP